MTVAVLATTSLRQADMVIPDHLQRDLRRAEEFIQLAVLASQEVMKKAPGLDGQRTGIYLGTAFGPMQCNLSVLDDLVMEEPISPTLFSHSVFNAASGYISRICKIYGPALTLTSFAWPFFSALQCAWQALNNGEIEHALVLQVETYSSLLTDSRTAMLGEALSPWPPGATAWLLAPNGPCRLHSISVIEEPCAPEARLSCPEREGENVENHPLAAAESVSALVASNDFPETWQKSATYGRVELHLTRGER